jgi:UTP--glucose-1-phosphate uridylyltransferase
MFETKMKAAGLSNAAIDAFKYNYEQLVAGVTGLVSFALNVLGFSS